MSESRDSDDRRAKEFGSEVPVGEEAEERVQEILEESELPEVQPENLPDGPDEAIDWSPTDRAERPTETTTDFRQCSTEERTPERSTKPFGGSGGSNSPTPKPSVGSKNVSTHNSALMLPWVGEQYEQDKTKFCRTVVENRKCGYPTRLSEGVRAIYGDGYSNTEYNRLSGFAERCDWLRIDRGDGFVVVEPEPTCFKQDSLLSPSYESSQKEGRDGDGQSTVDGSETAGDGGRSKTPKERVNSYLKSYKTVQAESMKRDLFRDYLTWRKSVEELYNYLRQYRNRAMTDKDWLIVEYPSRFKDTDEAKKSLNRLKTGFDKARESYSRGVMVTLTPDPKRFESNAEILEAVQHGVRTFIECFGYRLGSRPDYVKVLEFQKSGLPHYHIALFGVRVVDDGESETGDSTISEREVREYWDETRGVGKQVRVQPIFVRDNAWLLHVDRDGRGRTLYQYLGESMQRLRELTETSVSELQEKVDAGEVRLWRQVLYWAYGKQYVSCSTGLKEPSDENDAPDIKQWEYVGTAKYEQIPTHVRENAKMLKG